VKGTIVICNKKGLDEVLGKAYLHFLFLWRFEWKENSKCSLLQTPKDDEPLK
jgi:hypothetical protein